MTIDAGVIIGTTTAIASATATVNQYLGVPFAQSPPERFSPPQPAPPYGSPLTAQQRKPACIQQFQYPLASVEFKKHVFSDPLPEESEDCLYLNVFAPSTPAPPDGRAVMYWIFGGSLQFGNGGQPIYDGSYLAVSEDVIVVTVNYRTNGTSPGLLYSPGLQHASSKLTRIQSSASQRLLSSPSTATTWASWISAPAFNGYRTTLPPSVVRQPKSLSLAKAREPGP